VPWPGRAGPVFRLDRQKAGMYVCIVLVLWLLVLHEQLSWNFDTNMTATKANTARAFISRNIHSCFKKVKAACYTTLVRPMMEYATFALAPHTTLRWIADIRLDWPTDMFENFLHQPVSFNLLS